ncbi:MULTISPECIES: hypothetical protein [Mesorhizobium]|nr:MULTISPECIES: hypothetical protein [Mesorhizobium]MBE1706715.1 hypothetical protein [Mesorhizobium japonicum]MBE1714774.1 hypothetical protein [Mesorhizobium japonicum]MUT22936.1 hypothetical protein [Mesorhizobium japonicum]MUT27024.1 hypothetical protein [Mesorhizobium japonicum]PBB15464.1 hypothetical protein CK231_00195 [Mesorhizobium loti]
MGKPSEAAMPLFSSKRRETRPPAGNEGEAKPPPFPTVSTFLGIAAVMIVIWLLVYGPPFSASDHPVPPNNSEAGASK